MQGFTRTAVRRALSRTSPVSLTDASLTPAAVMLLLYRKNGEDCILLNKRSDSVEDHKGEIAFPGGRKDLSDASLLDTALRETHEEMGIHPQDVEVLGEMDDVATITNYVIRPFVGSIRHPYTFRPSRREVAEVLEVPVESLTNGTAVRDEVRVVDGGEVNTPSYAYRGHLIFGATATILRRMLKVLDEA